MHLCRESSFIANTISNVNPCIGESNGSDDIGAIEFPESTHGDADVGEGGKLQDGQEPLGDRHEGTYEFKRL